MARCRPPAHSAVACCCLPLGLSAGFCFKLDPKGLSRRQLATKTQSSTITTAQPRHLELGALLRHLRLFLLQGRALGIQSSLHPTRLATSDSASRYPPCLRVRRAFVSCTSAVSRSRSARSLQRQGEGTARRRAGPKRSAWTPLPGRRPSAPQRGSSPLLCSQWLGRGPGGGRRGIAAGPLGGRERLELRLLRVELGLGHGGHGLSRIRSCALKAGTSELKPWGPRLQGQKALLQRSSLQISFGQVLDPLCLTLSI